ncbi:MAG: metallophosphoesterase [Gemmatimonadota bacterium]
MNRKRAAYAGITVAAAALGIYTTMVEPRWIELKRVRIHVRGLPEGLEGLRIGVLADLHAGSVWTPLARVRQAARLMMGERPDLVALVGDFASERLGTFQPVFEALSGISAPLGVYAVPGNHDHHIGIDRWAREVREDSKLVDLTNRSIVLKVDGARLCVAGVDDLSCGDPSLGSLPSPEARDTTILLAHNPDQAERARRAYDRVDLVVSGHTHGGQVRLPWIGTVLSSVEHDELYEEGLRRRPWTQVYTSRGIGTVHLPVRLLSRPEVTILELTGAPRPPLARPRSAG